MSNTKPFIIQFSSMDHFVQEIKTISFPVVRVSGVEFSTGGTMPGWTCRAIQCQTINGENILCCLCVAVGLYSSIYGKPFGPQAEAAAAVTELRTEAAQSLVSQYIIEQTNAIIRPGLIQSGLDAHSINRVGWDGLNHIYDEIRATFGQEN